MAKENAVVLNDEELDLIAGGGLPEFMKGLVGLKDWKKMTNDERKALILGLVKEGKLLYEVIAGYVKKLK